MQGRLAVAAIILGTLLVGPVEARYHYRYHHHHRHYHFWHSDDSQIIAHPSGCPGRAFCGCGASVAIFGHPIRNLFLAANWFRFPRTSPHSGAVAVRRHHVFVLREPRQGSVWLVEDYNSGGHASRRHERSIAGYVIVQPSGV